jgi:hypothetical protein
MSRRIWLAMRVNSTVEMVGEGAAEVVWDMMR